ncbi:MAG: bifunctional methylenetetrahydrofolate dehydrogenase/methenyltetrahydrofolate cyclohydrolase FolD [Solirubrobacterales bacterium]
MPARLIDGKAVAVEVRARVREEVAAYEREAGRSPLLATVLVGEDPASQIYIRNKHEACEEARMRSVHRDLPADASEDEVLQLVHRLGDDDEVDGILVQLPLPEGIDADAVVAAIDPGKDVDGLTPANAGLLAHGTPGLVPCTPAGVIELLRHERVELEGAEAVVVGRSKLVGVPVARLLLGADATVTVCHSRTRDLAAVCRRADVLVAAVGVLLLLGADAIKPGAVVIDVGMNRTGDGLCGDVDFEPAAAVAAAITPVPGGVGPMTIAMLLGNTLAAARARV